MKINYAEQFKTARQLAQNPSEKSALVLLQSCMRKNAYFKSSSGHDYLMLDVAQEMCLVEEVSQVTLVDGADKGLAVAAMYERLGFKFDPEWKRRIGLAP